ncbi:MAG: hypothetical protein PVI79_09825 [Gammaproteobacteria bacterium]|jgi:hypothetical protein
MFKWFFRHENHQETVDREAAMNRKLAMRRELATRASIASKLKNYKADEDTTISQFTLAEDAPQRKHKSVSTGVKIRDPWGQANPGETGKWNREDRKLRVRKSSGNPR